MKLCIRIPTNASVHYALVPWLAWAARQFPSADISVTYTYGYGIAWGRNKMVEELLDSDCTHLWMIDSDTVPNYSTHLTESADSRDVVCAPYNGFHEDEGLIWHVYSLDEKNGQYRICGPDMWPQLDAPFGVDAAGLGCCIVRREVFERMREDLEHPFYHPISPDGTIVGEDFRFCEDVGGVVIEPRDAARHCRDTDLLDAWNQGEQRVEEELKFAAIKSNGSTTKEVAA
jgi:hypothetical protein